MKWYLIERCVFPMFLAEQFRPIILGTLLIIQSTGAINISS